jgi:sulfofructose kinase
MTPPADGVQPPEVVGLGYCSWDYLGIVDQMPAFDAPTMSLSDFAASGGGPVSTALVALARLGARTGFVGCVGDDESGMKIKAAKEREGVDISRLRVQPGTRSQTCFVLVESGSGRRSILCHRGSTHDVELDSVDRDYITAARFLHLDGHHMLAAIQAAQWMRDAGRTVVLDANRPRARLNDLLCRVDVLITNAWFPKAYTGQADPSVAAKQLMSGGIRFVVTTLGEKGSSVFTPDRSWHVPGFAVPVVDTTGAGDAFHGAFIYGMLRGWELNRTALFANAVAALKCAALGGRAALPTLQQTEAFLRARGYDSGACEPTLS